MSETPQERRERYLRTRELKGRKPGSGVAPQSSGGRTAVATNKPPTRKDTPQEAAARVASLQGKISKLEGALTKALTELAEKRRSAAKTEKENSDGKTTVKERQQAKESRDKNQTKNKAEAKKEAAKDKASSGGSSSSSSSSSTSGESSVESLEARVSKIKSALQSAKRQLSAAKTASGQLSHSSTSVGPLRLPAPTIRKESVQMTADFGGYATRHDVPCADGRTIRPGAFQENDGQIVPLVWSHGHNDVKNVLGHCKLEYRPDGVYAHAYFNETSAGQDAKIQVQHGDIKFLSIFANQLKEEAKAGLAHIKDVVKGNIREVSLVLAGANPGAYIDNVSFAHSDGEYLVEEAQITTGIEIDVNDLSHADTDTDTEVSEEDLQEVLDTLDGKQANAVNYLLTQALLAHSDTDGDEEEEDAEADADADSEVDADADQDADASTEDSEVAEGDDAKDDADAESDTDKDADADADAATDTSTEAGDDVQHNDSQEDNSMTHNLFDAAKNSQGSRPQVTLTPDEVNTIVHSAMSSSSGKLSDAVRDFVASKGVTVNGELKHGIENIEYLFPDAQLLENSPAFISRRMEWVDKVLSSVRKSPFSRIKTITADITPDEARARGYIKGNMKNEEFFALSKRETTPQTIYKKQKLDRDDVIDIVNLDVVAWLKAEMKVMLDEEIAGAILVGDGRSIGDDDKIKESNIRPIASDAELYVTTVNVNLDDGSSSVEELVDAVIANRRYYKGTGQPTFFTTEGTISAFLTVKDNFGRRLYGNLAEVAAVLRVTEVVPVEVMERVPDLVGIMVNLADYTLGADRGGQATMFDDFDIDYNKLRYLIETRLSGALTTPKSALVFRKVAGSSTLATPVAPSFNESTSTVTVPTVTGVTYKNADTDATLTTASPVVLAEGVDLNVVAVPTSGRYFASNQNDEWSYTGVEV